jgi:hypothetical protein
LHFSSNKRPFWKPDSINEHRFQWNIGLYFSCGLWSHLTLFHQSGITATNAGGIGGHGISKPITADGLFSQGSITVNAAAKILIAVNVSILVDSGLPIY